MENGAKFGETLATGAARVVRMSGIGVAFAYLTALSIISVTLVVTFLTAHQFQHAIRTAESEGKPVALWKVIELRDTWKNAQVALKQQSTELEIASLELDKLLGLQAEADAASSRAFGDARRAEDSLANHLLSAGAPIDVVKNIGDEDSNIKLGRYSAVVAQLVDTKSETAKELQAELADLKSAYEEIQRLSIESGARYPQIVVLQKRTEDAQTRVKEKTKEFQNLLGSDPANSAHGNMLGNFLSQLNALDNSLLSSFGSFATMEPDLLTLLLVLAMGTLGGTIHLARLYIGNEATSVGYFLYRPFLGAITALVVFVIARTGVFVIAEPVGQGGSGPLSPFFISFVAIISGLLAEQALASVQGVGTNWFSQPLATKGSKYALRVAELAKAQEKDKAALLKNSGLSDKEVDALFNGQPPVDLSVQRIAAVWLGVPARELFTDLPP